LMRWTTADPIGYGDGMNWYQGEGDNTINGVDASGLKKIVILFEGLVSPIPGLTNRWVKTYWEPTVTAIPDTQEQYYDEGKEKDALKYVMDNIKKIDEYGHPCRNTVIIAGFSFGGDSAIALANLLGDQGIKVYAGLTVDPRWRNDSMFGTDGDKGKRPFTKPKNASLWYNHFQHSGGYNGNSVSGAEVDAEMLPGFFRPDVKPLDIVKNPSNSLDSAYKNSHVNGYAVEGFSFQLDDLIRNAPIDDAPILLA